MRFESTQELLLGDREHRSGIVVPEGKTVSIEPESTVAQLVYVGSMGQDLQVLRKNLSPLLCIAEERQHGADTAFWLCGLDDVKQSVPERVVSAPEITPAVSLFIVDTANTSIEALEDVARGPLCRSRPTFTAVLLACHDEKYAKAALKLADMVVLPRGDLKMPVREVLAHTVNNLVRGLILSNLPCMDAGEVLALSNSGRLARYTSLPVDKAATVEPLALKLREMHCAADKFQSHPIGLLAIIEASYVDGFVDAIEIISDVARKLTDDTASVSLTCVDERRQTVQRTLTLIEFFEC